MGPIIAIFTGRRRAQSTAVCIAALILARAVWAEDAPPPAAQRSVDFLKDVQPIFAGNCHKCHGSEKQRNGLRLDQRETMLHGGESGPAIVPGDSGKSLLIRLVSGLDPDRPMPPKGDRLTPEQIGILRAWIDQGAKWADAAAPTTQPMQSAAPKEMDPLYELMMADARELLIRRRAARLARVLTPPSPPDVPGPVFNEIDKFILTKWREAKLPAADHPPPVCSDNNFLRRV